MNNYPSYRSEREPLMIMPNGQVIYWTRPQSSYIRLQSEIGKIRSWGVKHLGALFLAMAARLSRVHRCAHCPIRCQAAAKPHSLFARLHRWHITWWPGWKSYLAEQAAHKAG